MNKSQANTLKRAVFAAVEEQVTKLNIQRDEVELVIKCEVQETVHMDWPEEERG